MLVRNILNMEPALSVSETPLTCRVWMWNLKRIRTVALSTKGRDPASSGGVPGLKDPESKAQGTCVETQTGLSCKDQGSGYKIGNN